MVQWLWGKKEEKEDIKEEDKRHTKISKIPEGNGRNNAKEIMAENWRRQEYSKKGESLVEKKWK